MKTIQISQDFTNHEDIIADSAGAQIAILSKS